MASDNRKVILYISCSLDGYISAENDDLSFLSKVQKEGEDYGYSDFVESIDAVIVGRKTFDWVINQGYEYPHLDKELYVVFRSKNGKEGNINYYSGELTDLINTLKSKRGKNIYCDGGSEIVQLLLRNNLIDELILSIIPVMLGAGTPLFKEGRPERDLSLISSKSFDTGLTQLHYQFT